ncbi:MAG: TFIIB-type zinc finger domain-containing protein [Candidatus Helarchaeota archaeon]|nr:TFIIB-type zinc finger domain-containing protein [Candidatus Helarchaeota archaeon]
MAKDGATITFGIIYTICVGLCWIFLFLPQLPYYYPYIFSLGGIFTLFANFFLIPSLVLYLIFYWSTEGHTSASVGFGLGLPGWVLGLLGQIFEYIFGYGGFGISIWLIAFYTTLTVFGSLLFTRRHKWEEGLTPLSPTTPQPTPLGTETPNPPCPNCNRATRFIPQYSRYYCDHCQKYL